jgi:hypothetical protein
VVIFEVNEAKWRIRMAEKRDSKVKVRCLNCLERFEPPPAAAQAVCPKCGVEWRLYWVSPDFVKIRGPVWSKLEPEPSK